MELSPQYFTPGIIKSSAHGDILELWSQMHISKIKMSVTGISMIVVLKEFFLDLDIDISKISLQQFWEQTIPVNISIYILILKQLVYISFNMFIYDHFSVELEVIYWRIKETYVMRNNDKHISISGIILETLSLTINDPTHCARIHIFLIFSHKAIGVIIDDTLTDNLVNPKLP